MANPTTSLSDSFDQWRQNTNQTASNVGDPASLQTTDKTSLVAAVNELQSSGATTGFSVAMAIALG